MDKNEYSKEIDLHDYGYNYDITDYKDGQTIARVTAVHRERFELVCCYGNVSGRLKSTEYYIYGEAFPTVGDFVIIDYIWDSECRIVRTLKRSSYFSRLDPSSSGHGEQVVAANFDYVFVLQSLNDDFNIRRLERYMTLALQSGAIPVVLLTKADLLTQKNPGLSEKRINEAKTAALNSPVIAISSKTGYGFDALNELLQPRKTIVFLGSSGVGKSSLVNALAGEEIMNVNGIREDDSKGRHTTTHRQLVKLKSGVMVIDTPGMREIGMWDVSEGLGESFADVEMYIDKCKFHDCTHKNEPGCAVNEAIADGRLSQERFMSYLNLKSEAKFSDAKPDYLKRKQEWHKQIAKVNRQRKNSRG